MAAPAPSRPSQSIPLLLCHFLALLLCATVLHAGLKWEPISKEELADNKPHVDPEAGAEVILRNVEYDHSSKNEAKDTYFVRVKVYNRRGIEDFAKIELPYDNNTSITNIMARTIKPDESTVELNANEIYDREVIKVGEARVKVKSFAPPGIEPGAIVEYRYTEIKREPVSFIPLFFQAEQPARKVHYRVKPLKLKPALLSQLRLEAMFFNCPDQPLKPDKDGWLVFEMSNMTAVEDEPFQPPGINIRSCIIVYYAVNNGTVSPKQYWSDFSTELQGYLDVTAKTTWELRAAVESIVEKTDSDEIKLQKIYDYCRTKIVNRSSHTSGFSAMQLEKMKKNETAADTLKSGNGTHDDINILFAALTRAAGLVTRLVGCNDRTRILFNPTLTESSLLLPDLVVSVRVGEQWEWKYFDPGCTYLPYGFVAWANTLTAAIASDTQGKVKLVNIPGPDAEASTLLRKAELTLDTEGTIEGDVTETYSGYREAGLKYVLDGKTPNERETYIRDDFQEYQKRAEVSHVVVENAALPLTQLKITYHLRIPDYAEKTSSRLFVIPAVFQKGVPPWFEATARSTALIFNYRFATDDQIKITMPETYEPEQTSAPDKLDLSKLGTYHANIEVNHKTIVYQRKFSLTGLSFDKNSYQTIKMAFEAVHKNDNHTLALKLKEAAPEPGVASAANPDKTRESEVDKLPKN